MLRLCNWSLSPLEGSRLGPTSTLLPSNPHFSFRPPVVQRSYVPLCPFLSLLLKRFERVLSLLCLNIKVRVRTGGSFQNPACLPPHVKKTLELVKSFRLTTQKPGLVSEQQRALWAVPEPILSLLLEGRLA